MQFAQDFQRKSEDEYIKEAGLTIDLDEIARKGGMSKEEKNVAKWYGIYASRQPGNHMARIVIPGGVISSTQARNIANVAEKYAQGRLSVTTRQAIQLHWLKNGNLADMIRDLAKEANTTKHGCGDVTRTIAACPLAETCRYRRLNVLPYAQRAAKYLGDAVDLENLPRKFKISFSGCGAGCAQPYINCVGVVAVQRGGSVSGDFPGGSAAAGVGAANSAVGPSQGTETAAPEVGFEVIIGGGMGWKAFVGQKLFSFVPEDRIQRVLRAIALLFRDHGDRFDRARSRLKFVVERLGIDACRDIVLEFLRAEGVSTEGLETAPFVETGTPYPDRPLIEEDPVGTDGLATVRAMIPMGEIGHKEFRALAELADTYGNQRVYTTNRQNIEIKGIEIKNLRAVKDGVKALGFATSGFFGLTDVVPCVGTTYCPKAVSKTRDLYSAVMEVVRKDRFRAIEKKAIVNITGCPNSCSPYRIADIGFRGMRIREDLGSVEGYEMLIGGQEQDFGKKLGEFKLEDCPEVLETVLDHFVEVREGEETLADCVRRRGIESFKEAVFHAV